MARLYDMAEGYKNIADLLDDPTMDTDTISTALATIEQDITLKAGNIAGLLRSMDSDIEAIRAEEYRLAGRRQVQENRQRWLKGYIQESMERAGLEKIKTPLFSISLQKNPPAVVIDDITKIPPQFVTTTIQQVVDKKKARAFLKEGMVITGLHIESGVGLRIR